MATVDVYNLKREKVGTVDLADEVFAAEVKEHLFYEVVKAQLASMQQGFAEIEAWLSAARIGTGARLDDVLEACAVAIAAREPAGSVPAVTANVYGPMPPETVMFWL